MEDKVFSLDIYRSYRFYHLWDRTRALDEKCNTMFGTDLEHLFFIVNFRLITVIVMSHSMVWKLSLELVSSPVV